ncbi:hypothetical protein C8J56DRAFT_1168092 [Mycena floridula]|nr:hypothetical protein C8J56DRAFT_1168092 [Mycena floridula]
MLSGYITIPFSSCSSRLRPRLSSVNQRKTRRFRKSFPVPFALAMSTELDRPFNIRRRSARFLCSNHPESFFIVERFPFWSSRSRTTNRRHRQSDHYWVDGFGASSDTTRIHNSFIFIFLLLSDLLLPILLFENEFWLLLAHSTTFLGRVGDKDLEAVEVTNETLACYLHYSGYEPVSAALLRSRLPSPGTRRKLFGPLFGSRTATAIFLIIDRACSQVSLKLGPGRRTWLFSLSSQLAASPQNPRFTSTCPVSLSHRDYRPPTIIMLLLRFSTPSQVEPDCLVWSFLLQRQNYGNCSDLGFQKGFLQMKSEEARPMRRCFVHAQRQ